jgi:RHS repeat-associated protein
LLNISNLCISYYPFGATQEGLNYVSTTLTDNDLTNKYLFGGKEQDSKTGFYEYHFRQYDSWLGRWHVVDPMAEAYGTQSPYHFAGNNPINNGKVNGAVWQEAVADGIERDIDEWGNVASGGTGTRTTYRGPTTFFGSGGYYGVYGSNGYMGSSINGRFYASNGPGFDDLDAWLENGKVGSLGGFYWHTSVLGKSVESWNNLNRPFSVDVGDAEFEAWDESPDGSNPPPVIYLLNGTMPYTSQGALPEACLKAVMTMLYNYFRNDNISLDATINIAYNGKSLAGSKDDMINVIGESNVVVTSNLNQVTQALLNGFPSILIYQINPGQYHTAVVTGMNYITKKFILNDPDPKKGAGYDKVPFSQPFDLYIITGINDYMKEVNDYYFNKLPYQH